jgi:hypothetical protein
MFSAEAFARMTPEQRRRISLLGVQAMELKRLRDEPRIYLPIPEGLQLAALFLDLRTPVPRANHILLFEAGYKNRYSWMMNNNAKDGLIGWHDAVRHGAMPVRPMIAHQ